MTTQMQISPPSPKSINVIHEAPAWLTPSERLTIYSLVFSMEAERVLEIGTLHGGSAQIICAAMDDVGRGSLVCVDPNPDIWIEWESVAHRATMLKGYSPAVLPKAREIAGGDFDLAYIDGGHAYDEVRADVLGVLPFMRPDSYMLFHDAHHPPVREALDDLVMSTVGITDCGLISRFKSEADGHDWGGLRLLWVRL
jgi:predicted O-methyltransferase YrrM